jgi:hypothetical protein
MKSTLLLFIALLSIHNSHAIRPSKVIHSYKISLASQQDLPQLGYALLRLELVKGNKRKEKDIEGEVAGTRFWKKFDISTSNGVVRDGLLFPDFETLPDSGDITLHVKSRYYRGKEKTFRLRLPVLTKIEIIPEREANHGQGSVLRFDIKGTFSDGRSYLLSDKRGYHGFMKSDFQVIVNRELRQDLSYTVPYLSTEQNSMVIEVSHKRKDISGKYKVRIDHKVRYREAYTASNGHDGSDGNTPASTKGCRGRNGNNGSNGVKGEDGKTLMIYARVYSVDSMSILKIKVSDGNAYNYYTINCDGGRLSMELRGGKGGNGGDGGCGGDAYARCSTESVYGGDGGNGGHGGDGGRGGNAVIFTDSFSIACLRQALDISNPGGEPGDGGRRGGRGQGEGPSDKNQSFLSLLLPGGS